MIKNNAIYYYDKVRNNWCTHGIIFTVMKDDVLWAVDTYNRQNLKIDYFTEFDRRWKVEDIENDLEYVMDIDEITEVDKRTFDLWSDKDKVHIPMGSWHERYLVNKNKGIDKENEIWKLNSEIKSLKWSIKSKQRELIEKENRLKEIETN